MSYDPKLDLNIGDQSDNSEDDDNMMEEENVEENDKGDGSESDEPSEEFEKVFVKSKLESDPLKNTNSEDESSLEINLSDLEENEGNDNISGSEEEDEEEDDGEDDEEEDTENEEEEDTENEEEEEEGEDDENDDDDNNYEEEEEEYNEDEEEKPKEEEEKEEGEVEESSDNKSKKQSQRHALKRYFHEVDTNTICFNCNQVGHTQRECPNPPAAKPCYYCGRVTHTTEKCNFIVCSKCGNIGHISYKCKNTLTSKERILSCILCNVKGHSDVNCPLNMKISSFDSYSLRCPVCFKQRYEKCNHHQPNISKELYCAHCGKSGHTWMGCINDPKKKRIRKSHYNDYNSEENFYKNYKQPSEDIIQPNPSYKAYSNKKSHNRTSHSPYKEYNHNNDVKISNNQKKNKKNKKHNKSHH